MSLRSDKSRVNRWQKICLHVTKTSAKLIFLSTSIHLVSCVNFLTDYNEIQKIKKLFEKLSLSLRKTLSVYSRQFDILIEIKIVFTRMYNSQKRIRKKKVEKKIAQQQHSDFIYFIAFVISTSILFTKFTISMHLAKFTIHFHQHIESQSRSRNSVIDTLIITNKCFICDELKHTWKFCSNAIKYKKRQWHDLQVIQMNLNVEFNDFDSIRTFFTRDDSMFDSFVNNMFDFFVKKFLIINCILFFDSNQHKLEILIDIDVTKYAFIDKQIAQLICDMLHMKFVSLLKSKLFIEFDDRHVSLIIHVIYFKLTIELHFELIALLLIIDLNNHSIILKKIMNKQAWSHIEHDVR